MKSSKKRRRVIGTSTKLTNADWEKILSRNWKEKYRLVLETIRDNGNNPTSVEQLREKSPNFYLGERDRINDRLREAKSPFFVRNVVYGPKCAHFQVVRR